jgi:cyclomaltodextrinase / maltogenic alpha-amylase / neopullulanase
MPLMYRIHAAIRPFLILIASLWLLSDAADAQTHPDWARNLGMYEVNVRQYTPEGTFTAFEMHLDRLQDLGAGILWLMPVHPIGQQNRLGTLGSYYSVRDFLDINPEFGTKEDFRRLVQEIHARGIYVIMDWVPNHTSWDNPLTTEHPQWYTKDSGGNFIPPPGTNWSDVIQLDHSQQGLRDYMVDAMTYWVEEFGIDGFRFDAAGFVPMDFWQEVLPRMRNVRPELLMLAEDNGPEFHEAGFDMTFGWDYYGFGQGVIKRIANGTGNANDLAAYVENQISTYPDDAWRLYFTSNHDENSWYGTPRELFGDAAEVLAVITGTFHGMPLIYSGQEAGLDKRLAFFDKDLIPWGDHPYFALYRTLFELKRNNRALWNGHYGGNLQRITTNHNTSVFAFTREKDGDRIFAAMNLRDTTLDVLFLGTTYAGAYEDAFTGDPVELAGSSRFNLPPYGYVVYHQTAGTVSVPSEAGRPKRFTLDQNYPNPFNPTTTITYTLPESGLVTIGVYRINGQRVSVIENGVRASGTHSVTWDATGLASGVYFYRIRAGDYSAVRQMVLVK